MTIETRDRVAMAARVAADIPEGWWVNLGIGIPVLVADHVPLDREVVFHSENGVLGHGSGARRQTRSNPWLINAGKTHVTLRQGGSYVHQADSFALIRGGHLDLCVLGAFEVAREWRHRQLVALGQRLRAGGRRRDGPCGGCEAAVGGDGTHHQGRRVTAGEAMLLPVDGAGRGQPRLHQSGRVGRHRARVRRGGYRAGLDFAGLQERTAATAPSAGLISLLAQVGRHA